ncbi:MAG: holo-[acyl-carrier-protein] synthase [Phycisphaera sp.]|nr:MAG: holo-[acyl-carrier-protein] synthase [Phycisphaera sp.]
MTRVIAHGIDLVDVARIEKSLTDHGQRFIDRCFTQQEAEYAQSAKAPRDIERFAARFAAKEAVLKSLGTGWASGIAWTDVEVRRLPSGVPTIHVSGKAAEIAQGLGITEFHLSLSHTPTQAMASVIACGPA